MKKSFLRLSIVGALMLSGCGSSSENNDEIDEISVSTDVKELIIPEANKVERANWDGIAPAVDDFFITDNETKLSFKIKDSHIGTGNYRTEAIYIDSDNNSDTGYNRTRIGNIGAEYMIEGSNLYKNIDNNWDWEFLTKVDISIEGDEMEVEFSKSVLDYSQTISTTAVLIDNNWDAINRTDVATYNPISLDDAIRERTLFIKEKKSVPEHNVNLNFEFTSNIISSNQFGIETIFLDTDNDPNTGYNRSRIGDIGADYLVEGNNLYKHSGNGWSWNKIDGGIVEFNKDNNKLSVTINGKSLEHSSTIKSYVSLLDQNWNVVDNFGVHESNDLDLTMQILDKLTHHYNRNFFFIEEVLDSPDLYVVSSNDESGASYFDLIDASNYKFPFIFQNITKDDEPSFYHPTSLDMHTLSYIVHPVDELSDGGGIYQVKRMGSFSLDLRLDIINYLERNFSDDDNSGYTLRRNDTFSVNSIDDNLYLVSYIISNPYGQDNSMIVDVISKNGDDFTTISNISYNHSDSPPYLNMEILNLDKENNTVEFTVSAGASGLGKFWIKVKHKYNYVTNETQSEELGSSRNY